MAMDGREAVDGREAAPPQDRAFDRRSFLGRMTAVTAAASMGIPAVTPLPLSGGASRPFAPEVPLPDPESLRQEDPAGLTLAEAAVMIREGYLSPVELLEAYLARIEAKDELYMAFNTVVAERARERARRLDRAPWRGPLHGIPVAVKDNYYTAGVPTTANSFIFEDFVPEFDATAWARLREAGAVLLGKTQMGPLATSRATTPEGDVTTVNAWAPHDPDVSPGGSSSGSATAVAARMAAAGTGTQTGGSITNPALAQGLTGIKPTMGRVSLYGIIPLTYTRDHPGPIARDAKDAAIMLQAMAGPDPADPRTLGLPPVPDYVRAAEPVLRAGRPALRWPTTIGVPPGYLDESEEVEEQPGEDPIPPERRRRMEEARRRQQAAIEARRRMLTRFEELGARVVDVEWPDEWDTLTSWDFNNVRLPERSEPFLDVLKEDVRLFGVSLSPWINGLLLSGTEYLRGQRAKLLLLRRVLDGLFAHCDVVLQTRPFPFDMIGLPLVAFPVGTDGSAGAERPVGAMLGGLPYGEERLLSLVAAYQSVTDWHRRRPAEPGAGPGTGSRGGARGGEPGLPGGRGRIDLREVMEHGE